jgi:hypothetical protein
MFITKPEFQHHVPDALKLSPDSTYWAAVFLSTEAHWYLLSYRAGPDADTVTVAVAWESDLLSILDVLGREAIVGVSRVSSSGAPGRWSTQDIQEVWVPPEQNAELQEALLIRLRGERKLRNAYLRFENHDLDGWKLMAST